MQSPLCLRPSKNAVHSETRLDPQKVASRPRPISSTRTLILFLHFSSIQAFWCVEYLDLTGVLEGLKTLSLYLSVPVLSFHKRLILTLCGSECLYVCNCAVENPCQLHFKMKQSQMRLYDFTVHCCQTESKLK